MKVYYAHSLHLYGTPQEQRDIELLQKLGFDVINPNSQPFRDMVEKAKKEAEKLGTTDPGGLIMWEFQKFIESDEVDAVVFRAHPDNKVPAGVWKEVQSALEVGKPVIELPTLIPSRGLSVADTREYLKLLGQR